jgi:hypothetical protein
MDEKIASRIHQAFPFKVEKHPLLGPIGQSTPYYGLFRDDTGVAVGYGSVSERYEPHTTEDVAAVCEAAAVALGGVYEFQSHFANGHHVVLEPKREHRLAIYGSQDAVWMRLVLDAGYGGRQSFRVSLATYRDICRNLAILRQAEGTTVSIQHTSSLRQEMTALVDQLSLLREGWGNIAAVVRQMESNQVNLTDFLTALYPAPNPDEQRAVTIHRNRTEAIVRRLIQERARAGRPPLGEDYVVTGWEAYNAVQGYVQHDTVRQGNPTAMSRAVRSLHDHRVAEAERLALSM